MSHTLGAKVGDSRDFRWGTHRGVGRKNKDTHFYESFVYEGVEYFLYDCAYFHTHDHVETSVGKLVQMYERPTHEKMVKVVWFFRPSEIRNFIGGYQPRWNELFLASGAGKGVCNVNPLESIIGKCSVVCTSKDKRNPEPSETELKSADFFFNCAFDVGRRAIFDKFADEIEGVEVGKFFNKKVGKKTNNPVHVGTNTRPRIVIKTRARPCDTLCGQVEDNTEVRTSENAMPESSSHSFPYKKRQIIDDKLTISQSSKSPKDKEVDVNVAKFRQDNKVNTCRKLAENDESSLHSFPHKMWKIGDDKLTISQSSQYSKDENFDGMAPTLRQDKRVETWGKVTRVTKRPDAGKIADKKFTVSLSSKSLKDKEFDEKVEKIRLDRKVETCQKVIEVTERPDADRRRWFKKMHWDERLREAQDNGTLVLLNNLDPSYTSYEVEDLVWHALKKKVEARVIEQSPHSNKYYGRALVIFKTKDAAEFALSELRRRCLMLGDGRIVSAQKGTLTEPDNQSQFNGHLSIHRFARQKQHQEMRNAVSTSHCAQTNTVEFPMAIDWLMQYEKSDAWWEALYQKQMKEIEDVKNKLKMDRIFS